MGNLFVKQFLLLCLLFFAFGEATQVSLGIDQLLLPENIGKLKKKKVGLVTNHTAVNAERKSTLEILKENAKEYKLVALFAPEHGLFGREYAGQTVKDENE